MTTKGTSVFEKSEQHLRKSSDQCIKPTDAENKAWAEKFMRDTKKIRDRVGKSQPSSKH